MTVEELILIDKYKVRRDSNLMSLYLQYFKETFNYLPNCAGCSFASDWQKLVSKYSKKYVTLQKVKSMKTISIKKQQGKILSYKKDGKTFRLYDNILTDDFIKEYLINGTDEEISERKKLFVFPIHPDEHIPFVEKAIEETLKVVLDEELKTPKPIFTEQELDSAKNIVDNFLEVETERIVKTRKKRTPKNG